MPPRSPEQVKRDLEAERVRLETAVGALRSQAVTVRRKLPLAAVGLAGAGILLRTVVKTVARRTRQGRDGRGRRSFRGGE